MTFPNMEGKILQSFPCIQNSVTLIWYVEQGDLAPSYKFSYK